MFNPVTKYRLLYALTLSGYFGIMLLLPVWYGWLAPPDTVPAQVPLIALGLPLFAPPPPTKIITLDDDPNISGQCDQGGALVQKDLGPGSYYVSVKNNSADCDVTIKVVPKMLPGKPIVLPAAGKGGKLGGGFFSLTTPMTLVITCAGGKKGSVCSIAYNLKQYL